MVQIEGFRLFILGINDKSMHSDFRPGGTIHGVPQQGAPKFASMVGESDGKAPQPRDGHSGIAWQAFGKPDWHLSKENPACG